MKDSWASTCESFRSRAWLKRVDRETENRAKEQEEREEVSSEKRQKNTVQMRRRKKTRTEIPELIVAGVQTQNN